MIFLPNVCMEEYNNKMLNFTNLCFQFSHHITVADLHSKILDAHPPGVQILSISCSFWEILAPGELAPPTSGKSWIFHYITFEVHGNENIFYESLHDPSHMCGINPVYSTWLLDISTNQLRDI